MLGPYCIDMASIYEVSRIIGKIAEELEGEVVSCMDSNKGVVRDCIQEQLYSGQNGEGRLLSPDYDNDPFFNEDGPWKDKAERYKRWKERITPPIRSYLLNLPPRPVEVPNLFILGTFYDSISIRQKTGGVEIYSDGFTDGSSIVRKYGDNILSLGDTAKEYFILNHLRPWLERFLIGCGYY